MGKSRGQQAAALGIAQEARENAGEGTSLSTVHCFVPGVAPPIPGMCVWLCPSSSWPTRERLDIPGGGKGCTLSTLYKTVPLPLFTRVMGLILARAIPVQGLFLW